MRSEHPRQDIISIIQRNRAEGEDVGYLLFPKKGHALVR